MAYGSGVILRRNSDGKEVLIADDGRVMVSGDVLLRTTDIQIGAIELKDGTSDNRAQVYPNSAVKVSGDINIVPVVKTVEAELLPITAVAAATTQISSVFDISEIDKVCVYIDHGRDATTAPTTGPEYRVEVSQKNAGNDVWATLWNVVCDNTLAAQPTQDGDEAAGQTAIECGAIVPSGEGIVLFRDTGDVTLSEWNKITTIVLTPGSEAFNLQDPLTLAHAAGNTNIFDKGERFVIPMNVEPYTRLRVVVNNARSIGTNQDIVSRAAVISVK